MALAIAQSLTLRTSGLAEARRKLLSLPPRLATNVCRRGLYAAAKVIAGEARALVPQPPVKSRRGNIRTGALRKAIKHSSRGIFKDSSGRPVGHKAVVTIGKKPKGFAGVNPRRYAHLVERGVKPHMVGKGSSRKGGRGHGRMHPGFPGVFFMRRAFFSKGPAAVTEFERVVAREVEVELNKLRTGAAVGAAGASA